MHPFTVCMAIKCHLFLDSVKGADYDHSMKKNRERQPREAVGASVLVRLYFTLTADVLIRLIGELKFEFLMFNFFLFFISIKGKQRTIK